MPDKRKLGAKPTVTFNGIDLTAFTPQPSMDDEVKNTAANLQKSAQDESDRKAREAQAKLALGIGKKK